MSEIVIRHDMDVRKLQWMGSDEAIARAAKVSVVGGDSRDAIQLSNLIAYLMELYPMGSEIWDAYGIGHDIEVQLEAIILKPEALKGLINYLMKHRHGSPFEHASVTFFVNAPIFVFREFQRHRIASYNEMSGRYTELKPHFYIPALGTPLVNQGSSARPNLSNEDLNIERIQVLEQVIDTESYHAFDVCWKAYKTMLQAGIANEKARAVLPVGIYSEMWVTMNLRGWMNFLSLRTSNEEAIFVSHPQWEIEMVAQVIEKELKKLFPIAMDAFQKNGRVAP